MQYHGELAAALVLRLELGLPVAEQHFGIFQPGALPGEQQEELIVEVIVVGQRQDRAAAGEIAHPVVRQVVGQAIAEIGIAVLDQQVDGVAAHRAAGELVGRPRQREPAGRSFSGHASENLGRALQSRAFLILAEQADILVLETMGGDLMALVAQAADRVGMDFGDDRRHGDRRLERAAPEHTEQRTESTMQAEIGVGRGKILRLEAVGPAGRREIDDDAEAAAIAIRPGDLGIQQGSLVTDRIAFFPRHGGTPQRGG
jgi:hypothetical protein